MFFENSHKVKFAQSETNLNFSVHKLGTVIWSSLTSETNYIIIIPQNYCPNVRINIFVKKFKKYGLKSQHKVRKRKKIAQCEFFLRKYKSRTKCETHKVKLHNVRATCNNLQYDSDRAIPS